ncbi:MAG: HesA/MoeB/ThiF family protein, partial [Bacteroidota bacterium]
MLNPHELKRYNRHIILPEIGLEGQQKLKLAKVLVIGAGGLGCPLLQYLAAAGVGTIGVVDSDTVDESNLHRQILYSSNEVGKNKADIAAKKLSELNPFIKITPIVSYLNSENALQLFSDFDIIIDGSDNFATRYLVNDACVILNKPFVSGSIYKFQGQISVFNYHEGPTYRCLYPEPGDIPNCAEVGVLGVLPGIVGCLMANETIKMIIGNGEVLSGKLLVFDSLTMQFNTFGFSTVAENKNIKTLS